MNKWPIVKAQSTTDIRKPPRTWSVTDDEVLLSNRESRSEKPEVHYLLADPKDDTLPFDKPLSPPSAPLPPLQLDEFDSSTSSIEDRATDIVVTGEQALVLSGPPLVTTVELDGAIVTTSALASVVGVGATTGAVSTSTVTVTSTHTVVTAAHAQPASAPAVAVQSDLGDDAGLPPAGANADSDVDMAEGASVSPTQFRGTAQEDAEQWMRFFLNYCEYKGYDNAKKLALMKVLLVDGAATWLDSQPAEVTTAWEALKTTFLARYSIPEFMRFKGAKELFNMKQQLSQSCDDFLAQMQHAAKLVGADEKMLLYAALNGLRSDIAAFVTQRQPKDVKELLDAARVAELTNPTPATEKESAMSVQIALVQDQLRELSARLDRPTVSSVRQQDTQQRQRSPSPRRVTFCDDESRFDRQDYRRFDSPRRFDRGGRFRDDRPSRDGGRGRQGRGRGRVSRGVYRSGPPTRAAFEQQQSCSRCGGYAHESFNSCPAVNQHCRICWKRGHFWKVCRSAAPRTQ